jgi:hypothetical protein
MEGTLISYGQKLSREQLAFVPTPQGTETHRPISHIEVVNALVETLGFRHIGIHKDEYAVSKDGMRVFGLMELETTFSGCRFLLGLRNSHNKTLALALTVGYRVMVCENLAFHGDFTPVMRKHTKNFDLKASLSIGIDSMQRNFEPMVQAVQLWQETQITNVEAKMMIYEAFIEGQLEAPKHLARVVHDGYFNPPHFDAPNEFAPRTMWSLQNSFTGAFGTLDPIPQHLAATSFARFIANGRS